MAVEALSVRGSNLAEVCEGYRLWYPDLVDQSKVEQHRDRMQSGLWEDDPPRPQRNCIVLRTDGLVGPGEHRVAAARLVDWDTAPRDPSFTVLRGVEWTTYWGLWAEIHRMVWAVEGPDVERSRNSFG